MNIIQNIDNSILQFIQVNMRSSIMDKVMPLITDLGNGAIIWMLIAIAFLINKKYRRYGLMIIVALMLCFIVGNLSIKPLVARVRPFNAKPLLDGLLIKQPADFSFPSGHTMCSFASGVVIFYMNRRIGIFALIISSLIGFSRLYLYVHYPSDVFLGMVIGILLGSLSIIIIKRLKVF
ncbi:phosphatase PAP2 family protein [Clostridium gelidum]|uniref:Phosphatase PAP2 family protein n=1 Tax=Clostridium gelidum TaxID=704125 RepID=A0ABN6J0T4_9CLOT|nr:phosphatase PAP2 family protein [Clostridium gelidum]BCZ47959.1 phosphatase PAP2 family protein [Clostridium gelidum]